MENDSFKWFFTPAEKLPEGVGYGVFTPKHFALIAVSVLLIIVITVIYRRADKRRRILIRRFIAVYLVVSETIYLIVLHRCGGDVTYFLPLEICSFGVYAIILFLAVEDGHYITKKEMIIAQIPFWLYVAVYAIMVVGIGEARGGWADMYEATSRLPIWLVLLLLGVIGYGAAVFLRILHNRAVTRGINRLTSQWDPKLSDVELKIEALGLGRYMATHLDESEVVIPVDILRLMSDRCGVSLDELSRAYAKGVVQGMNEEKRES